VLPVHAMLFLGVFKKNELNLTSLHRRSSERSWELAEQLELAEPLGMAQYTDATLHSVA
jgi:hypothetical protein